jgi:hypothetical protein
MLKTRHFTRLLSVAIAASGVGCSTFSAWNFEADPKSAQLVGEVKLLLPLKPKGSTANPLELSGFEKASEAYKNSCTPKSQQEVPLVLATLIPVVGEMLFGFAVDHAGRKLDEIKEASEASYAARGTFTAGQIRAMAAGQECLVVLRYSPADPAGKSQLSMAAILKLSLVSEAGSGAVAMQPVYVGAKNSAALTRRAPDASVAIGLAMSFKAIGKQPSGLPILASIGETSSAASKVPLGGAGACVSKACAVTEPLPLPVDDSSLVVLGIGVAEKGSVGFDVDVAKAQLTAIKASIGPVISDLLKAKGS